MMKRWSAVVGALAFVSLLYTRAWAEEAGGQEGTSAWGFLTVLTVFAPPLILILFLVFLSERSKRTGVQFTRSIEIAEESLLLAKEQVALQRETNRLLGQLAEAARRD